MNVDFLFLFACTVLVDRHEQPVDVSEDGDCHQQSKVSQTGREDPQLACTLNQQAELVNNLLLKGNPMKLVPNIITNTFELSFLKYKTRSCMHHRLKATDQMTTGTEQQNVAVVEPTIHKCINEDNACVICERLSNDKERTQLVK